MIVKREDIRPVIREMETVEDLQALINACFNTLEEDKDFVQECASEIYWREKAEGKYQMKYYVVYITEDGDPGVAEFDKDDLVESMNEEEGARCLILTLLISIE